MLLAPTALPSPSAAAFALPFPMFGAAGPRAVERRRGSRVRQRRAVRVHAPREGRYVAGRTVDCGAGGLRVELPARADLHVDDCVWVHVGAAHGAAEIAGRRPTVAARVRWTKVVGRVRPTLVAGLELVNDVDADAGVCAA